MARLAVLYALDDEQIMQLKDLPEDERYDYMLEEIEDELFGTSRCCELDKAWEGIQYCLCGGEWSEDNSVPANIVFGGEFLADNDEDVMTLKSKEDVRNIVEYLRSNDLKEIIRKNFSRIEADNFQYKDENGLNHALEWSEDILPFYENAMKEGLQVIFTVDL